MRALILAAFLAGTVTATAAPPEGVTVDPEIGAWFRSLVNPKLQAYGGVCCDQSDGRVLADSDWRTGQSGYEVRVNGEWRAVPADAVLERISNPTGGAVLFVYRDQILCFVRPSET